MTQIQEITQAITPLFKEGKVIATQVVKSGVLSYQVRGVMELVIFLVLVSFAFCFYGHFNKNVKRESELNKQIEEHKNDIGGGFTPSKALQSYISEKQHCDEQATFSGISLIILAIGSIPFLYFGLLNLITPTWQLFKNLIGH